MAALNYNIYLTDTGNNGSGPYTLTVIKNPGTVASGGTSIFIPAQTSQAMSMFEFAVIGAHAAGNDIAKVNQTDALN